MSNRPDNDVKDRASRRTPRVPGRKIDAIVGASSLDEGSDRVISACGELANALGAQVVLAHAVPLPAISSWMPPVTADAYTFIQGNQRETLIDQAQRLGIEDAQVHVEHGPPDLVIEEACKQYGGDVIVIGAARGHGPFDRMLGSTAEHVVRNATCPVLVVRRPLQVPPAAVLAPVDLSPLSVDAFHAGLHVVERLAGKNPVEVEVLFVLDPAQRDEAPQFTPEQVERLAREELDALVEGTPTAANVRLIPRLLVGEPRGEILHLLEDEACDLMVLGTRGEGGLKRLFGSVAARIARDAPTNVLLVPPPSAFGESLAEAVYEQTAP